MIKWLVRLAFTLLLLVAAAVSVQAIRQAWAAAQVQRDRQAPVAPLANLGEVAALEIIPLFEEAGDADAYQVGHGVSYWIRAGETTLLLDLGNNFQENTPLPSLENLHQLGLTWDEIDSVVISHPHPDHIGGLPAWQQRSLGYGSLGSSSQPVDWSGKAVFVPVPLTLAGGTAQLAEAPAVIAPGLASLGTIPFAEVWPLSLFDPLGHEQALAVNVAGQGLVLITGCGHPSLERLVERAEALLAAPVIGVVGGLHYEGQTAEQVAPHIAFLAPRQPRLVALSPHDSGPEAMAAFQAAFPDGYQTLQVGQKLVFPTQK